MDERRVKELIEMFAKSEDLLGHPDEHTIEAAELKKAWITHIFSSLSKLNAAVNEVKAEQNRTNTEVLKDTHAVKLALSGLKLEFKEALSEFKDELRKEEIKPLQSKVTDLFIKVSTWGVLGGFLGSGLMALIVFLFKESIKKYLTS